MNSLSHKLRIELKLKPKIGKYTSRIFIYIYLLSLINQFIFFHSHCSLVDAYLDVCDYFEVERIPSFAERFPRQFSLEHVTAIWKHAVSYQQEQKNNQEV